MGFASSVQRHVWYFADPQLYKVGCVGFEIVTAAGFECLSTPQQQKGTVHCVFPTKCCSMKALLGAAEEDCSYKTLSYYKIGQVTIRGSIAELEIMLLEV